MPNPLIQSLTLLGVGFVLGLEHALDADHVVAVSTIVSRTKSLKKSSIFGALWGAGHTTTLFLVGFLVLFFKISIPQKITQSFEFIVGLMLIFMGTSLLVATLKERRHAHIHKHDASVHIHEHTHHDEEHHHHQSFFVGMVHGLAGSAALMLLVLSTVKSVGQGLLFILIFGVGSIGGMLITSTLIGLPFIVTTKFERVNITVKIIAALASIFVGFSIIYEVALVKHLLF